MGSENFNREKLLIDVFSPACPSIVQIINYAREMNPGSSDPEALKKYAQHYEAVAKKTKTPEVMLRIKLATDLSEVLKKKQEEFNRSLLNNN